MYKPSYSYSYSAKELKDLFGKKVFSYSKSTELLSDFIEISTDEGTLSWISFLDQALQVHQY